MSTMLDKLSRVTAINLETKKTLLRGINGGEQKEDQNGV